ncbi:FkbM family methyltransferase [Dolichospermum sp. ST_sed9]|nr:FkbM family methyltransferase [Dolichospermum sp. ST_sed9]
MNVRSKILDMVQDQHPMRRLIAGSIGRSGLARLLKIKIKVQDYVIFFHPTGLSSKYWYKPTVDSEDYEFISSFLKEGDTYIDIGANIGITLIPAAKCIGDSGKAIAFEPHPKIYSYLRENVDLNNLSGLEIHNCAVGNSEGYIYFTDKFTDEKNSVSNTSENSIKVPIISLDNALKQINNISLLKLDVEGYEKYVLESAQKTLEKVNCIYFEVCPENYENFGYQTSDVLTLLKEYNFKLFRRKDKEKELVPVINQYVPLSGLENLFGIKNVEDFQNRTQWKVRFE